MITLARNILGATMMGILLILLAACGSGERDFVLQSIPDSPDLAGFPDRLHQRIENAELQILNGKDPVNGLADLSRIYHSNGFYEEASVCYQALHVCEPTEGKWAHMLAEILSSYGQLDEALPWRQKAVDLASDYVPAWIRLGDVYLKRNQISDAEAAYQSALKVDAENAYALVGLARIHIQKNNLEGARMALEKAIKSSDLAIGADLLATVYQELGLKAQAEALRGLAKASGSFIDIPDVWVAELYGESFDTYQIAVAAGMCERGRNLPGAIRLLQRALQLAPKDATLHFQLGQTYLGQGKTDQAIESFKACVENDPTFSDGWFRLADIYSTMGDSESEGVALATGLYHNPDSPGLHLANGARLKRAGNYQAAIREVEKAIQLRPEEASPYTELASLYIIESDYAKGIELLKKTLSIESLHPLALSTLVVFHISEGNEKEARESIAKAMLQPRISREDREDLISKFRQTFGANP